MKISAINSNYETKKLFKKNQIKNNVNMTTPSFEGMNKLNKVSAKKLALALMAGIAVTTPSVYAAPTKAVTESSIQNTDKNDFFINPDVAEKYPEINPAEHKNFDTLYINDFEGFSELPSFMQQDPLAIVRNSFDIQLLNYYAQNPQEKNLPNNEIIQDFINNYNQNKDSNQKKANNEDAQEILNKYKEISQKYNITEREAVWNFPAYVRYCYQCFEGASQYDYYEENGYFMNPVSENREKIQDFIISYDGSENDDSENFAVEGTKAYLPEVIDEINTRTINSEIHLKMISDNSKGSDYSKYLEPITISQKNINESSTQNKAGQRSFYINPKLAENILTVSELNDETYKNFDLYNLEQMSLWWIGDSEEYEAKMRFANSLDVELLNYYAQNPQAKNLPDDEYIEKIISNYNKTESYKVKLEQVEDILNQYKELSQEYNVTEREAVWNYPSSNRETYQSWLETAQKASFEQYNGFIKPSSENRKEIQDYIISHDGSEFDNRQKSVIDNMNGYLPEVIDEIHQRETNTLIFQKVLASEAQASSNKGVKSNTKTTTPQTSSATNSTVTKTNSTAAKEKARATTIELADLEIQKGDAEAKIWDIKIKMIDINSKISDKRFKFNNNQKEITYYESTIRRYKDDLERDKAEYQRSKNSSLTTQSYLNSKINHINNTERLIDKYEEKVRNYKYQNANLEYEIQCAESDLYYKKLELQQAERELQEAIKKLNMLQQ